MRGTTEVLWSIGDVKLCAKSQRMCMAQAHTHRRVHMRQAKETPPAPGPVQPLLIPSGATLVTPQSTAVVNSQGTTLSGSEHSNHYPAPRGPRQTVDNNALFKICLTLYSVMCHNCQNKRHTVSKGSKRTMCTYLTSTQVHCEDIRWRNWHAGLSCAISSSMSCPISMGA